MAESLKYKLGPAENERWLQLWWWHSNSKTTCNIQLQFQWLPHNVIGWKLHNLHSPLSPPSPFNLINLLLKVSLPFYKNLHFYEANKWHCLHKDITRWLINTRVNTFQKRLLIGNVCMQIDMAQQDVSCSAKVKQCKHKAPVCEGRQKKGLLPKELILDQFVLHSPALIH